MRFVCESCRAQYMINDEKVGPKGVKVRCRKCGYVILVKRADAARAAGPVVSSSDPDDALATQVMQTPLAGADATLSSDDGAAADADHTAPGVSASAAAGGGEGGPKDSFFGADEDEIGAVFDQVLKTGTGNSASYKAAEGASAEDRQSTRVIDADTVRKLAEESSADVKPAATPAVVPEPKEEIPQTDWYVAINEKQTGPLTLDKVKEHWDRGEISPDSLCWRAGFDDWIPVSEARMLSSVLAPKPPRPIVVAPAATITHSSVPAVVSVPVQSAFSAGGVVQTVQSEVQVPMAAAGAAAGDESVGWKPSAASALASLVKDEMEALSKPPPKPAPAAPVEESPLRGGGLLDLPAEEKPLAPTTNAATVAPMPAEVRHEAPPQRPAPPPPNPYLANPGATYSAPAVTQYRPPGNKNLMIAGIAGGAVLLLVVVVLLSYLAFRTPPQAVVVAPPPVQPPVAVVQPPPVVAQPAPVVAQPPPAQPVAQPTPIPTPAPTEVAAAQAPPAQPAATPTPAPAQPPPAQVAVAAPSQPKPVAQPKASPQPKPVATVARAEPEPEPKKAPAPSGGGDDDFDRAFGGSSSKPAPREEPKSEKKPAGYIPPAPGAAAGDVKESLGQADIMEVVLANKAALGKCVEEQKKKDPGTSGKLVMKWTIQTSGKTSNVGVVSEEFKGTYIATCIGGLVKGWQFPRHKKQGEPVQFPFKF